MVLQHDDFITFYDVPALLPEVRPGKRVHWQTVRRWSRKGIRGVKLKVQPVGHRRLTTVAWVEEFLAALAARDIPPEAVETTRKRSQELRAKNDALAAAGF